VVLEGYDTWRHPEVGFEQFKQHVTTDNPGIDEKAKSGMFVSESGQEVVYTTFFSGIEFTLGFGTPGGGEDVFGSSIFKIEYNTMHQDRFDTLVDSGINDTFYTGQFLDGNILNSAGDGKIEIRNPALGTTLTLDWSDRSHLVRTSEDGTVEQAIVRRGSGQMYELDLSRLGKEWVRRSSGGTRRRYHQLHAIPTTCLKAEE
jgi:hypothetical protein